MDGYTAREGVVNGQITDKGGGVVASLLIHIPIHMKVDRVVTHGLLAHVQQLHPRHVDSPVASLHLEENHRHSLKKNLSSNQVCVWIALITLNYHIILSDVQI